ncbi:PrsW family intramembrane metalloprotease [Rhizomonospora bruguierae]|uniref:PrsW family intramembrane metalloprotease n=1 Tax=Rhizomonospora bruguierae TaxID=1581705 RepID=UPI001BCAB5EC|nr:PrsW family intramembrane metalloprotease [Micromonospora sp. NBRC 107566]
MSADTAVRPAPATGRRVPVHLPAFWLLLVLLAAGAAKVTLLLHGLFARYPAATVTAVALFALYAVPFWLFVTALDYLEREPPLLLAAAFAWGALVATAAAIPGATAAHNLVAKLTSPRYAAAWGSAVVGPTVEEVLKALGIVVIVLVARAQVNSVLDGVVYGALVGLGFQVVENIVYAVNAVALAGNGDRVGPVVATFFLRGFLAGLWSHALFGALAGAGIGYAVISARRRRSTRIAVAALALCGAWLCHFVWNSPVLVDGVGWGPYGVLLVLLLKGVPPLVGILLLVRVAREREADYYAAHLAELDDPEISTEGERRALSVGKLRSDARQYAYTSAGLRAGHAVRRLQRAQARLAVELSRAHDCADAGCADAACTEGAQGCRSPWVDRWRAEVLDQRARLRVLGHPEAVPPQPRPRDWRRWAGPAAGALALLLAWAAIRALGGS